MKYLSLFSGIGGFELGIMRAYGSRHADRGEDGGGEKDTSDDQGQGLLAEEGESPGSEEGRAGERPADLPYERPLCVGYSEIDKYAIKIYEKHFPDHRNYGDIGLIPCEELPQFDMLVGGFPCQSFSIAGKRGGFEDTRGTLFFEIARILRAKQPRLFLLENVKGLLSHDAGRTFKTIVATLDELGYDLQWQVLNSKDFGVPQNRERVFIVGHLRGTARPEVFPFGEDNKGIHEEGKGVQGKVSAEGETGQNGELPGVKILQDGMHGQLHQLNQPRHSNDRIQQREHGFFKGSDLGIAPSIRGASVAHNVFVNRIRRLTPLECERLQGFPDNWTEGISDTQRYKCLGNAVTANVIEGIMEKFLS